MATDKQGRSGGPLAKGLTQQVEQREVLLASLDVRVRDVQQGPDGNLYIATELQSGGVNPDGTVMRIEPAPQQ